MNSTASRQLAMPPMPLMGMPNPGVRASPADHVQRDGLHRRAAVAAVRRQVANARLEREAVDVDADDALDGVDERNAVRAAALGGQPVRHDVRHVRRELHQHGHRRVVDGPRRDALVDLRLLPHGRAHAALAHAVRAAEVQLQAVGTRVHSALDDVLPLLLGLHHQGDDDRVLRVLLLGLVDLLEVHLERPVGDELDVVEADGRRAAEADRAEAARHVLDGLPERLPHRAAPARVEGALHLVAGVGRRRRGQPEGVGGADPRAVRRDIRHGRLRDTGGWRAPRLCLPPRR